MYNSPIRNNKLLQEAYLKGYRQALYETPPSFQQQGQQSPAPYRSKAGTNNRMPYKGQGGGGPIGAGMPTGPAPEGMYWHEFDYCEIYDCYLDCDANGTNCKPFKGRSPVWIAMPLD